MHNILQYFALAAVFTLTVSTGCSPLAEPAPGTDGGPASITYEYLYECLWTVADISESNNMPRVVADQQGALSFRKTGEIWLMQRKPDLQEHPDKRVYSVAATVKYALDPETRTLTLPGGEIDGYFRIERLNDRTLTLYYRDDPNSYVAYNRYSFESIIIER